MPLGIPYVPEFITVHLGTPASNAQNVTVSFPDYIKNVASSEIYPTWSDSAIYANIYAQISFALNRVYLEFYRSQGYPFNITSSTAYDQSFEYGRNIFENISRIVDEIFNNYIRRVGFIEPLAARYCNGTTVTCDGLSQWGSESLAVNRGYNSIQILRYYYGDDIELVVDAPIQGVVNSYPGTPVRRGNTGNNVRIIQVSLNRISQDYPLIPKINPVDGIFGSQTEEAVRQFQRIFNLAPDGIVGKATWYQIRRIYTGIKRLSELESEGQTLFGRSLEYPDAISEGDVGEKVFILQYMLSILAEFYDTVPFVPITGSFGEETKQSVIAVQRNNNLPLTGVVNAQTWDVIYMEFIGILNTILPRRNNVEVTPFAGEILKLGSRGDSVRDLQQYLNTISLVYTEINPVSVTGVYDQETMLSVIQYQELFCLPMTGQVDRVTWNSIIGTYQDVILAYRPLATQNPGYTLKQGDTDTFVSSSSES